jgi:hypothetical protein
MTGRSSCNPLVAGLALDKGERILPSRRNDDGLGPSKELLWFAVCGTLCAAFFRNSNRPPQKATAIKADASADGFSCESPNLTAKEQAR